MGGAAESLATTLGYHERTKHYPGRYARALGHMDWATQPDPFRRFVGAPLLELGSRASRGSSPGTSRRFSRDASRPNRSVADAMSQLFHDSLALSAWKEAGGERWPLRVNPSSGNLHPTEGYLVAGPVAGLHDRAGRLPLRTPRARPGDGGPSCPTRPGPRWRGSCRPEACWWASPRSTGARPGSTASGRSATATTTSATPSAPSPSPRRGWAGTHGSAKASPTPIWPACWELTVRVGPRPRTPIACWRFLLGPRPSPSTSSVRSRSRCRRARSGRPSGMAPPTASAPSTARTGP